MSFQYYRPSNSLPPVIKYLIIVNAVVFILQMVIPILNDILPLYAIKSPYFKPHQIITHLFAHGSFFHILFNMYSLYLFGKELESRWDSKRFLNFYLLCGMGAAALHLLVQHLFFQQALDATINNSAQQAELLNAIYKSRALGASGAVMGVFAAYGYLFPNRELIVFPIFIPIKVKWIVLGFIAIDLFGGFSGTDNIAHFAHLGGAITGFLLVYISNKTNRGTFY